LNNPYGIRTYLKVVIEYFTIILFGVIIFFIDDREISNIEQTKIFIAFISFLKTIYFIIFNYKNILSVSKNDTPYYTFLVFICINVMLIIFSFAVDYTCLYWIDPTSFSNIREPISLSRMFFEFIYISILSYTNFGFAESLSLSGFAKLIIIFQDVIAYAMTIFILADFVSLKESLKENFLRKKSK
jgi:hypothetical protein